MFEALRLLYSLFILLVLPLIFARLWLRSTRLPAYRHRLLERLGIYRNFDPQIGGVWIHAVSVGEVVAAIPLVKALQQQKPQSPITITTMTPTGSQRVQQSFGNTVTHVYMPYDIPWAIKRLIKKLQPSCLIIMETELWPNVLQQCTRHKIPVMIANGRISDRSLRGYMRFKWFITRILQQVTFVAAQSKTDAERFLRLGLPANKVAAVGNLKFEIAVSSQQTQQGLALKHTLSDRMIFVAASTHANEEEQILDAFKQVQQHLPQFLLILAPRHPDRFQLVTQLLQQHNLNFITRSSGTIPEHDTEVILGDTMGELQVFYAAADVAFVGGSLVPVGGHNLLEPAMHGVPSITGPHTENFKDITKLLLDANAIMIVQNSQQLAQQIIDWLSQPILRQQLGNNARQVVAENGGAVFAIYRYLEQHKCLPVVYTAKN